MSRNKATDEDLRTIVAASKNMREVLDRLGLRLTGGSYAHYSRRLKRANISTKHFTGNRGCSFPRRRKSAKEIFENSGKLNRPKSHLLTRALLESGVVHKCSILGCHAKPIWLGKPLTLHVDHVDGDWSNNKIENLRFLCPNCHSQTSTFGSKVRHSTPTASGQS